MKIGVLKHSSASKAGRSWAGNFGKDVASSQLPNISKFQIFTGRDST